MKIVVLDGYALNPGDISWERMGKIGSLTVYDRTYLTDDQEIADRRRVAEPVLTNKTPMPKVLVNT